MKFFKIQTDEELHIIMADNYTIHDEYISFDVKGLTKFIVFKKSIVYIHIKDSL